LNWREKNSDKKDSKSISLVQKAYEKVRSRIFVFAWIIFFKRGKVLFSYEKDLSRDKKHRFLEKKLNIGNFSFLGKNLFFFFLRVKF